MIFYITKDTNADMAVDISTDTLSEVLPLINSNMKVLQRMKPLFATAGRCYVSASCLLKSLGYGEHLVNGKISLDDLANLKDIEGPPINITSAQITPESVLNPLAIYSLARKDIEEKHSPEYVTSNYSSTANTPSDRGTSMVAPAGDIYGPQEAAASLQPLQGQLPGPPSIASIDPYLDRDLDFQSEQFPLWQSDLDNYPIGCLPGLDYSWQLAETVQQGMESRGFPLVGQ